MLSPEKQYTADFWHAANPRYRFGEIFNATKMDNTNYTCLQNIQHHPRYPQCKRQSNYMYVLHHYIFLGNARSHCLLHFKTLPQAFSLPAYIYSTLSGTRNQRVKFQLSLIANINHKFCCMHI